MSSIAAKLILLSCVRGVQRWTCEASPAKKNLPGTTASAHAFDMTSHGILSPPTCHARFATGPLSPRHGCVRGKRCLGLRGVGALQTSGSNNWKQLGSRDATHSGPVAWSCLHVSAMTPHQMRCLIAACIDVAVADMCLGQRCSSKPILISLYVTVSTSLFLICECRAHCIDIGTYITALNRERGTPQ